MLSIRASVASVPFLLDPPADLGNGCNERPFVALKRSGGRCKRFRAVPAADGIDRDAAEGAEIRLVIGDETFDFINLDDGDATLRGMPRAGEASAGCSFGIRETPDGLPTVFRFDRPGVPLEVSATRAMAG